MITALSRSLPSAAKPRCEQIGQPLIEGGAELSIDGLVFPRDSARDGQRLGELAIGCRIDRRGQQLRVLVEHVTDQDLAEPVGLERGDDELPVSPGGG